MNDLNSKQMFDISEKLVVGQTDEIYGVNTINWVNSSWKHLSFIGGEEVISLSHAKVFRVFRFCVFCMDDRQFKEVEKESVGELSAVC